MSYQRPALRHPEEKKNRLGYSRAAYEGAISALCAGCGHDSICHAIITACFEMDIPPHRVVKLSGIGCSSKTPAYFLGRSHGFNSVHGRMPSVATGANMANRDLLYIGVSGDGDTASIGMGQFVHVVRRNLNMVYVVMNNGCYGLTKGQNSATADKGSKSKKGPVVNFEAIDLCALAIQLGAGFVGRGFSGDKAQLVTMLKAAVAYKGLAFLDVISPCVSFNNVATSSKSYSWVREHEDGGLPFDFIPARDEIVLDYPPAKIQELTLHDGAVIRLHKQDKGLEVRDRGAALTALEAAREDGRILTGMLYLEPDSQDTHELLGTSATPLNTLGAEELCPGSAVLKEINNSFR